ncbi:hypothetical protein [Kitasatospora sp. MAP5-34]|uniref:hypothetical protein n=1 Tax=Kitasatospora sp. MAP5-34 TaxID=3035102 RepID=UPI002475BA8D|nr:hypothetical protein [Kitasatospora sp. MAP5-34]MDH6580113.1 hypothetical protein [Kitasatospora sp. MAP5-34]
MNVVRRATLGALALVGALAALSGCGIRPTAVPVDAGPPASRTACPSPVRVPEAADTPPAPTPAATPSPAGGGPTVTAAPSKMPDGVFSATPSPSPSSAVTHCP